MAVPPLVLPGGNTMSLERVLVLIILVLLVYFIAVRVL